MGLDVVWEATGDVQAVGRAVGRAVGSVLSQTGQHNKSKHCSAGV
jgi:hypothetical protein